ncbi:MAG: M28 family peptidase [Halobacteriales archaeon]
MAIEDYALYERDEPSLDTFERTLYEEVSADEPWALVEEFSELERVSGSADEKAAARYITDRLDAHGVDYERYDPELWLSIPHEATLRATAPVEETFDAVKTISFSESGTVSGEVVYVEAPEAESMDDVLSGGIGEIEQDLEDKIVVLETMSIAIDTIRRLEDAGAKAFVGIHPHPDEPHEGIATPIWGAQPAPDETDKLPGIIIANVSRSVGDRLVELATGDEPLEVEVSADLTTDWFECPVVVAHIPGEAAPEDDDFVLLHGHYDSWYVGIADNATGDAGLLESARVFNEHREQLHRDLWVAWWPGHSTGRYAGSTWFVDEFAHDLADRCIAQLNMDSPGAADATEFEDMVMWMPEADALARSAIADVCGKDAQENRPVRAGDYSFNNLGISGLFMLSSNIPADVREQRGYHPVGGCGGNSNAWHLSTDTLDKADPDVLVRDIRVYVTAIKRLLNEPIPPLDFRHTVRRHKQYIADYADEAGAHFDFSPVQDELDALEAAVESFYDAIDAGTVDVGTATETMKALSRRLVRLDFTSEGQFEQDPATTRPPYPVLAPATTLSELDGDEYKFQRTQLKRARNHVVHELKQARRDLPTT